VPHTPQGARQLAAMLREDGQHYRGLSTGDVERVRGHILAAFEHCSLPADARHAVREELRTSFSPIVLAGAARAASGLNAGAEWRELLTSALERLAVRDEFVAWGKETAAPARTARAEISAALDMLDAVDKAPRHCCGPTAAQPPEPDSFSLCGHTLDGVATEDQADHRASLGALLRGRISLVAFFYTRCMNPAKCSLTITRLAALARLNTARGDDLNLLAISYDPAFDSPTRLHVFGRDRDFPFGGDARLIRCISGWPSVCRAFGLQVGYGGITVNAHARELFLITPRLDAVSVDCEALGDGAQLLERIGGTIGAEATS
jgi:protein SCO1/2